VTLELSDLFLWPLFLQLALLALLGWCYRRRGYHDLRSPKSHLYRCVTCRHLYIENRRIPLSKCPKCHTLNEMIRR
jgi:predicted SprT family Zn-dependent metalloprotease